MPIEYEVKLAGERDALLAALENVGAVLDGPRTLEDDLVLDTPESRLLHAGEFLRLRRRGGRYLLTFKGRQQPQAAPNATAPPGVVQHPVKARRELQTPVDDGPAMLALLQRLGFVVALRYQKYRTIFRCPSDGCERVVVSLDETPIGTFLEIEGDPGDIDRCAVALGFDDAAYDTRSYLEIHRDRGGSGDMVFPETESTSWLDGTDGDVAV